MDCGTHVFIAKLMDEPFDDIYGMHRNDEILVGYVDLKEDGQFLVGLPMD